MNIERPCGNTGTQYVPSTLEEKEVAYFFISKKKKEVQNVV